ncbi:MAG: hypothetical protein R8J84_04045 [Mariprofundales bacterium]
MHTILSFITIRLLAATGNRLGLDSNRPLGCGNRLLLDGSVCGFCVGELVQL